MITLALSNLAIELILDKEMLLLMIMFPVMLVWLRFIHLMVLVVTLAQSNKLSMRTKGRADKAVFGPQGESREVATFPAREILLMHARPWSLTYRTPDQRDKEGLRSALVRDLEH